MKISGPTAFRPRLIGSVRPEANAPLPARERASDRAGPRDAFEAKPGSTRHPPVLRPPVFGTAFHVSARTDVPGVRVSVGWASEIADGPRHLMVECAPGGSRAGTVTVHLNGKALWATVREGMDARQIAAALERAVNGRGGSCFAVRCSDGSPVRADVTVARWTGRPGPAARGADGFEEITEATARPGRPRSHQDT